MADLLKSPLPMSAPLPGAGPLLPDVGLPQGTPAAGKVNEGRGDGRSFAEELAKGAPAKTPVKSDSVPAKELRDVKSPGKESMPLAKAEARLDKPADRPVLAAAKTASTDDAAASDGAKRALQALRKVAQSGKDGIERTPVVNLLNGHLERLQPSQMPQLITGNGFVNEALSHDNAAQFLSKPAAVGDLLKGLDLPPQVMQQIDGLGVDLSQKVAPEELLKALGIDPQRVLAELTQLKDNLQLEGVAPYIKRALALGGKDAPKAPDAGLGTQQADALDLAEPSDAAPIGFALVHGFRPTQPLRDTLALAQDKPSIDWSPQALAALQLQMQQQPALPLSVLGAKQMPMAADDFYPMSAVAAQQTPKASEAMLARALPDGSLDVVAVQAQVMTGAQGAAPQANQATFDPFAMLGDKLRGMDTVIVREESVRTETRPLGLSAGSSLEEQLLSRNFGANPGGRPALIDALLNAPLPIASSEAMAQVAATMPQMQPALPQMKETIALRSPADMPLVNASGVDYLQQRPVQGLNLNMIDSEDGLSQAPHLKSPHSMADGPLQRPNLGAVMPANGSESSPSHGEQPADDQGGSLGHAKQPQDLWKGLNAASGKHAAHATFATQLAGTAEPVQMQSRVDMLQKLLSHASLLSKQGGGSMRLDLSSPELGPLEMAVHMDKDQLSLRVVAGSDRAREAMMADLNQLKGALSAQNVRLGNVEVGVGSRQPFGSQAFAGNQQFSGQREQSAGERPDPADWRGAQVGRISRPTRASLPLAALQNPYSDNGRIAVRA